MSAASPPREETFPKLSEEQRRRIAAFARERRFADGEMLWEQGDCNRPLFVVLEGKVTVLSDADHLVTEHEPGQFSGDVDLLSGRPVVVRGRATGETRVLELPAERLRALVQTDPELSEILLRAFILRRIALQALGQGSVVPPGGQAGSSSRIEIYLGFPMGVSGQALASNALVQAEKFGAAIAVARTAVRLSCDRRPYRLELAESVSVEARTVIIATGVQYRKPDLPNLARFEGGPRAEVRPIPCRR